MDYWRLPPPRCRCCHGARVVPAINGEPRPCSRCCSAEFDAWCRDRRKPQIAAVADPEPKTGVP